jgi:hypothetical protein
MGMAIGWLTVLKMVPWGDVIDNAPKVAVGAKKLWDKVGKRPAVVATPAPASAPVAGPTDAGATLAQLQAQVEALQLATAELHQQMLDSTELIKVLAEQNTRLIERVELNRKRLLWLALALTALVVAFFYYLF